MSARYTDETMCKLAQLYKGHVNVPEQAGTSQHNVTKMHVARNQSRSNKTAPEQLEDLHTHQNSLTLLDNHKRLHTDYVSQEQRCGRKCATYLANTL